jgi:C-terminal processing protease CtpA/Prc
MFLGSFADLDFTRFQTDVDSAVKAMKAAGVSKLLIDVTNNGGGLLLF